MSQSTIAEEIEEPKDWSKISHTRRTRGYNFEYKLVNSFNAIEGPKKKHHYHARRLGGSSTGMPDIVVTNKQKNLCYAIEAKSGDTNQLYIPLDQVERCLDMINNFLSIFRDKFVVFAFKFKANKKKGRKLSYRFIILTHLDMKGLKGLSYHIGRDEFIIHKEGLNYAIKNDSKTMIPIVNSIDLFLRYR